MAIGSEGRLTVADIHQSLSGAYIKSLQVFHFAFAMGVLVFFFVVLFAYLQTAAPSTTGDESLIQLLTFAHLVYALAAYGSSVLVHRTIVSRALADGVRMYSAERALSGLRTASVVRLAIMEAVAFFGLVALFLSIQTGTLQANPVYWVNLFSTVVLLTFVGWSFPSRERLELLVSRRLQQ